MASVTDICKDVVESVDGCLAVGVVDLGTGMIMGVHHTVPHFTQSYLDTVAAAAVDMFRGKSVKQVENLLSEQRGESLNDAFEEVFISSLKVFHFMSVMKEKGAVVVMVTKKTTNQGMGWAALKTNIPQIVAALP